jgi:hypothetical protein
LRHFSARLQNLMAFFRFAGGERYLVGDLQAVSIERHNFFRMVRENANSPQAKIDQNLRADSAFPLEQALTIEVAVNFAAIVDQNSRQGAVPRRRRVNLESTARVVKVDKYATFSPGDCVERSIDQFLAVARS